MLLYPQQLPESDTNAMSRSSGSPDPVPVLSLHAALARAIAIAKIACVARTVRNERKGIAEFSAKDYRRIS